MFLFQGSYHSDISTKCVRLCSQPSATPSPGVDNQLLLFRETGQKVREVSQLLFQGMEVELQTRRLSSQWPQFKTVSQHLLQSHLENHLEQNVGNDFSLRSITHTRLLSWLRLLRLVKVPQSWTPHEAKKCLSPTDANFFFLPVGMTEQKWSGAKCWCHVSVTAAVVWNTWIFFEEISGQFPAVFVATKSRKSWSLPSVLVVTWTCIFQAKLIGFFFLCLNQPRPWAQRCRNIKYQIRPKKLTRCKTATLLWHAGNICSGDLTEN